MKIRKINALRMNKGVFGGGNTRKEEFRGYSQGTHGGHRWGLGFSQMICIPPTRHLQYWKCRHPIHVFPFLLSFVLYVL